MPHSESRHIQGEVVLTLTDQLLRRCWPDVVNITFSNHDIKGHTTTDWIRLGLIPPNLEVEVPYRAIVPKGIENVLVAGKALSASHDALPAIRMQPDMENLGGVAALAAALAVRSGCSPRAIDVRTLQERLVAAQVLPPEILTRTLTPRQYTRAELEALVAALPQRYPLHTYSDMGLEEVFTGNIPFVDLACAGPQAIPLLEDALEHTEEIHRLLAAQALAMVGVQSGVPVLLEQIGAALSDDQLPGHDSHIRHANYPPDQGAMPDVAYLLYSLGMARDPRAMPVWQQVVERLASISDEDLRDRYKGIFYYVDAVCFGAERLGNPTAVPLLTKLHGYPPLHAQVAPSGFQPDFFAERQSYLELVIGRALARCGSPHGIVTLISYLGDTRALLAEHAHAELVAITGEDFGKDMAAWGRWLEGASDGLQPVPWSKPSEAVMAWDAEILTPAEKSAGFEH